MARPAQNPSEADLNLIARRWKNAVHGEMYHLENQISSPEIPEYAPIGTLPETLQADTHDLCKLLSAKDSALDVQAIREVGEFLQQWHLDRNTERLPSPICMASCLCRAMATINAGVPSSMEVGSQPDRTYPLDAELSPAVLTALRAIVSRFRAGEMSHPGLHFMEFEELTSGRMGPGIEEFLSRFIAQGRECYGPLWTKTPHSIFFGATTTAMEVFDGISRDCHRVLADADLLPPVHVHYESDTDQPQGAADWMMAAIEVLARNFGRADLYRDRDQIKVIHDGSPHLSDGEPVVMTYFLPNRYGFGSSHLADAGVDYAANFAIQDRPADRRWLETNLLFDIGSERLIISVYGRCVFNAAASAVELILAEAESPRPQLQLPHTEASLTGTAALLARAIRATPGRTSPKLAAELRVSEEHVRRLFREKLVALGFRSGGGKEGYYPPLADAN